MKLWCTKNLPVIDLQMPVVSKEYWYSQHLVTFEELQHKLAQCLTTVTCTFVNQSNHNKLFGAATYLQPILSGDIQQPPAISCQLVTE